MVHSAATIALTALLAAGAGQAVAAAPTADETKPRVLGQISFPNSGNAAAQAAFIEGVLYLHNFEYEDAERAFLAAQQADPDFALAYWGEAMTHNHPIWMAQYTDKANAALAKLGATVEARQAKAPTQRERDYLMAIETLYGNVERAAGKSKNERDLLYRDEMRRLHETHPDDDEAATLYALSILGTAHEGRDFRLYMLAAAVAEPVWERNREHPGAAHYLIHSYDDPIHAPLGLPMAHAYSKIAPAAAHAQHMTSHIFVALGMWDEVVAANDTASDVQHHHEHELGEPASLCAHYPYWLEYGHLQLGRLSDARQVMETCAARMANEPTRTELWHFGAMRARYVLDTGDFAALERWTAEFPENLGARDYHFADAYAAIRRGDRAAAERHLEALKASRSRDRMGQEREDPEKAVLVEEIEALMLLQAGKPDDALAKLRHAAETETSLPYEFGPPNVVKPAWELYGETLLDLGRHAEAASAFTRQLERTPRRTATLLGLARAQTGAGDTRAARETYGELAEIWKNAEPAVAALVAEAKEGSATAP
jgi:tetratricopeptide (TPR) repeat protein